MLRYNQDFYIPYQGGTNASRKLTKIDIEISFSAYENGKLKKSVLPKNSITYLHEPKIQLMLFHHKTNFHTHS